jgi:hypothetical protein
MAFEGRRIWQELRALRASPVGNAANDRERRAVYAAALRQAQELADAATSAGYATKALLLFYCLGQAARAIAATRIDDDAWRIVGHGASVEPSSPLFETTIRPKPSNRREGRDAFTALHAIENAEPITQRITLAELWRATPDTRACLPRQAWSETCPSPTIGGSDSPGYVSLWWTLLLTLSSLVRYEPALWTAAIDTDRSKLAVPLEQVSDKAEWLIPRILWMALRERA